MRHKKSEIDAKKQLHPAYNSKENVIKININNSFEHELAKFLLAWELMIQKNKIITEAIFKNNKRADIFNLTNNTAYEVLKTEKNKSIESKRSKYPVKIIPIDAEFIINTNLRIFLGLRRIKEIFFKPVLPK